MRYPNETVQLRLHMKTLSRNRVAWWLSRSKMTFVLTYCMKLRYYGTWPCVPHAVKYTPKHSADTRRAWKCMCLELIFLFFTHLKDTEKAEYECWSLPVHPSYIHVLAKKLDPRHWLRLAQLAQCCIIDSSLSLRTMVECSYYNLWQRKIFGLNSFPRVVRSLCYKAKVHAGSNMLPNKTCMWGGNHRMSPSA